jgi:hypothetical protein
MITSHTEKMYPSRMMHFEEDETEYVSIEVQSMCVLKKKRDQYIVE